ncbi:hypothetical protein ACJRO7_032311 [Eucalyptus globulus]|uniref:Pectinesterase inhibitor domain-containing protein n=1 Tax=Eucalyptus globulus TaxID=34317 RepID=A0ABD3JMS3_EUCGL
MDTGGSPDPAVEKCLSDYTDQYADAVEQMEASITAASAGDYGGLRPGRVQDGGLCYTALNKVFPTSNQMVMSRRNNVFKLLCYTALRVVELLELA